MVTPADSLTLGLLPEQKLNRRAIAAGYTGVALAILLLINLGLIFPQKLQLVQYHISSWIPVNLKPYKQEAPRKQPLAHKLVPAPSAVTIAKLTVPREIRVHEQPKPEMTAPKIETNHFMPAVLKTEGARPALVVHTGEFGSSAPVTVNAPIEKVQTGGFGDPNGVPGQGKSNAKLQIASAGSFDLPTGPGKGNGTGGAKGIAGNIASAGFGSGIATPGRGDGRSPGVGSVQTAGFAAQTTAPIPAKTQRQLDSGPATNPVEITYKPNPVYSDEARQLRIEGEVLLEVMFGSNGQLHVNRVVRGLGHGLDEAAVSAAGKMRFKPALRNGEPVDSTAVVHVVFQLAY